MANNSVNKILDMLSSVFTKIYDDGIKPWVRYIGEKGNFLHKKSEIENAAHLSNLERSLNQPDPKAPPKVIGSSSLIEDTVNNELVVNMAKVAYPIGGNVLVKFSN